MPANPQQTLYLPPLEPWMRNLLIGLFVLYVVELVLWNLGVPLGAMMLTSFGYGFQPWQVLTRFFVQGRENAANVLISIVVLYFVLPSLPRLLPWRQWVDALSVTAIVAMLIPMVSDALGLFPPATRSGWTFLVLPMFVGFGLAQPRGIINLMFVLPIPAIYIVWGTLVYVLVMLLAFPSAATLEMVASWIGIVGWWSFRGPGKRRRELRKEASKIEKELQRFTVLDGGKAQGGQGRDDDEWIH
ncbi:MAG: hypothetical protein H6737_26035 [Alphaproteobacteria bacterium]|nr:hypothetical protein [Alphaproteobacteria bacterium]